MRALLGDWRARNRLTVVEVSKLRLPTRNHMPNAEKVLIVEDEPHALMGLAELISGWGYKTETARDGIEGWEKARAWNPAIVVTDLKMPRMDGIGLLPKPAESTTGSVG